MRDKIVFHIRFISVYSVALALALVVSFALKNFYSVNYGFGLQALAFMLAFVFTRRTHRDYLDHLIAQSNRILFDRMIMSVILIAVFTAGLALALNWLIVPLTSYFKIASFSWTDIGRTICLAGINTLTAYFVTERTANSLIKQGRFVLPEFVPPAMPAIVASEAAAPQNEHITELLADLPQAKRETLIKGALKPGAPMITFKGSTNDQLWTALSKYGWTKKTRIARGVKKELVTNSAGKKLVGWAVTPKGAEAIAGISRDDPRANLRVVNG